ncbi:hypothetical protein [Celeribacter arenosi]|uniref:VPLPA-CTERM protein sorting domain-containing protein n=1 Tax=Celeribacter arenosi TaxID=792649 RepID=A0ABP7JVX3_9RHOB
MFNKFGKRTLAGALFAIMATSGAHAATYMQDFDGFADGTTNLGDGSYFGGAASVQGGQLRLTQNGAYGQHSTFWIGPLSGSSAGWSASFDYSISSDQGGYVGIPADGFSFNYGAIGAGQPSTQGEEGYPTVTPNLSFEMDTWQNGTTEVGPAIAVNNTDVAGGFINGDILAANSSIFGRISISVAADGTVSFVSTGALTNANFVDLATGFTLDDDLSFAFAARTGAATQTVLIDNLKVSTLAPVPLPAALPLLGGGVLLMGFVGRRRKRVS